MRPKKDLLREELIQYCNNIIEGQIVACKKHKWACMRFLRDLEREGSEEFPYVFNPYMDFDTGEVNENGDPIFEKKRPADRYLDWMRLFKHRKGPLANQFKEPVIYEKFVYGNIYGWVHKDTLKRRFRRSYEQLARKNAKSQDKGIQALYEISAFGELSAEAYVAATKKEQTRFVWGESDWLYKNSILRDSFTTKFDQELMQVIIKHKKSGSFFSRLSKDDKKTGDGANPQFMVLDEYHLHETTEYYDLGTSGMKTRSQPLLSIITTAGFELNNPCYRVEYDYVSKILDPDNPITNDRYFVMICELDRDEEGELIDDIKTEAARLKSNPIIGNTEVGKESIQIDLNEALDKPDKMRDVLTKTFNIWVNQRVAGYMNMDKWKACQESDDNPFPDVTRLTAYTGIDLSSSLDLTSSDFEIALPDGFYVGMSHSFMPEERFREKLKSDKVPYDLWEKWGFLTVTPGAEVDYHFVLQYIVDMYKKYDWPKGQIGFDQKMATWLEHELTELGFTPVAITQSYTGLSEATKDLRAKVYNKKYIQKKDPLMYWAMGNAILRTGPSGDIMLNKGMATQRIDPVAAKINAHVLAMVNEGEVNPYQERGVLGL